MRGKAWILIAVGAAAVLLFVGGAIAGSFWLALRLARPEAPKAPLAIRLDDRGPYLILASAEAEETYQRAISLARRLHPQAEFAVFSGSDPSTARPALERVRPRYAMVFVTPDQLDVNFAWSWLALTCSLDEDPFVDVRTGFITGKDGDSAARFVQRIADAASGKLLAPGKLVDNIGPSALADPDAFYLTRGCFMAPVFGKRYALATISHGPGGYSDERLQAMSDAGMVHLGGHGYPDRIVEGLKASQVDRLQLAPSVVFSGACYTGVTERWFDRDATGVTIVEKRTPADESFCLNLIDNQALAYLAAVHPDHGIPVYQEMEFLSWTGGSLGDAIKHTHDGVILARQEVAPPAPLVAGQPWPNWSAAEVMLHGTAARLLLGDPSLVAGERFTDPPFAIQVLSSSEDAMRVEAKVQNGELLASFTDTYHADLASDPNLFNDCLRATIELPPEWDDVREVSVVEVQAAGKAIEHRLVGYAVEQDGQHRRLHVQIDVATQGYMQSAFRSQQGSMVLDLRRGSRRH